MDPGVDDVQMVARLVGYGDRAKRGWKRENTAKDGLLKGLSRFTLSIL